ncbi:D-glucuronyl C5-epimerase family protein [uncultured Draconibacterium sp.]|uniref:D-glucuronyl C5-epimerase family protein n=1 Tax=uncultured Draconibacterium sp. TaxID=1573823 RepID=UPI0029C0BF3F|nr:D-glucuronyl C5-epimerase family protein [uncultured Draconibacterium sp.]
MKKVLFMLKKMIADFKSPKQRYPIVKDMHSHILGDYYFVFNENRVSAGKDQALINKFDENGIPINKTYIDVKDKDFVYFPISIGQMGLAVFNTYLKTKSEKDKNRFLKYAEWFYTNAEISDNLGARWLTEVKLPAYRTPENWQSAFSQSRGISILLRAYQLTGKEEYAKMAEKALISFTKPVSEGGVTSLTQWGPFYEEYTSSVPTLVLNGKIFALCGLYDFVRVFPENELARKLYDEGIETIKNCLHAYDMGFWSRYNLCEASWYPKIDPATISYQKLHVTQLKMLYQLTDEKIFEDYMLKFDKQNTLFNAFRMYFIKFRALRKLGRL